MQLYHHYEQSQGSHTTLPSNFNGIPYNAVGTFRCRTCLCVYVQFRDKSVFVAHMVALNLGFSSAEIARTIPAPGGSSGNQTSSSSSSSPSEEESSSSPGKYARQWTCLSNQGSALKALVLQQLHSQLGESLRSQAVSGFVVCPAITTDGPQAHGRWMREALQEFFHPVEIAHHEGHGFVAGPDVEAEFFEWAEDRVTEMGPEVHGWRSAGQEVETREEVGRNPFMGPWAFEFVGGRWGVVQERQERRGHGTR